MAIDRIPGVARRTVWGAVAVLGSLGVAAWGSRGTPGGAAAAQEGPSIGEATPSTSTAVALARLLPASGLVSVGVRPGQRVVELKVKEDDQVPAGAVLAILEGHEQARLQLELARAQQRRGEHERNARLAAARRAAEVTRRRLEEGRTLYKQFGGTLKGKDRYDAEMALYQVEMQDIKSQLDLELAGGTDPKGSAASPEEAILRGRVQLAESAVRETEVRATGPGRVLRILAHPGETSSGVLLVMGDLSTIVARAEVYQSDVPRIRNGDPAEVDILGTRVAGKVTRIGSIVGRNQLTSVDPRAMRDLRVVEVTIQLDRAAPADRYVDMEVEAVIRPSGAAGESRRGAG